MKILVLGATGMLGHKLLQILSDSYEVYGSVRHITSSLKTNPIFAESNLLGPADAYDISSITGIIKKTKPDVVINSIGIVKQLPESLDPIKSITINSLFPHQLSTICSEMEIRLLHYSTDCVFSGKKGLYKETDFPDADDLYGRTKLLGEVVGPGCLTLRTSLIGRELRTSHGLIEWFLSQKGTVKGYKRAIFSGLTTNAHARILAQIISEYPDLSGLYHLGTEPITKFDLLNLVKKIYNLDTIVEPDYFEENDRSLNSSKFRSETNITIPGWQEMIYEMYNDPILYKKPGE